MSSGPAKWSLARAINTGVMYPESFVGCHAGDAESWDDFKDFFYPVIEAYHEGFSMTKGSNLEGTPSERMDPSKISVELSKSAQEKIISTRIRIARNLAMFPLNPGGSKESRIKICTLMRRVYDAIPAEDELKGEMFLHSTMSDEQRQGLIDDHFLFRGADKMQAASGYHVDWPIGRAVYHNKNKQFVNWINEGDHLRIISMKMGADVKGCNNYEDITSIGRNNMRYLKWWNNVSILRSSHHVRQYSILICTSWKTIPRIFIVIFLIAS